VRRSHAERPIDLIDAHFGYPEGVGCMRVAGRLGIPCFITLRGFENEFIHRPSIGLQMRRSWQRAAGIVAVSHSLRRVALEQGADPERVAVIHNAIDRRLFDRGDRDSARQALGIPARAPLIVSVGHLIERKRHLVLVRAFASLRERFPDARLAIIGSDAPEPAHARRLRTGIEALGLGVCVQLAGNLPPEAVLRWLHAADLFALATAREGCCNAVLEALATGLPVVTTAVGDNREFVGDGTNGYLVAVDDDRALAARLAEGLGREWDRAAISRALHAQVGDWQAVAGRVVEFFGRTLARTPRA
jgi:glycosyltransferase involved in cell wall biosynthesis